MNRFKLILTALLTTGTVCLSACTDESASKADPTDDPTTQGDPCDNPCTENAKECRDNAVWACQKKDDAECPAWQIIETCGEGSVCDTASHTCKADCSVICNPEAAKRCENNVLQECVTDENGCGAWKVVQACEGVCNEQTLQCEVKTCKPDEYLDEQTKECKMREKFSIVFLPDTQKYTLPHGKDDPDILNEQLSWISAHRDELNIKAVIHLGDMTDSNHEEAWQMVKDAYNNNLASLDLPFLPATGNHDYLYCKTNEMKDCPYYRDRTNFSSKGGFNNAYFDTIKNNWTYAHFGGFYHTGSSYLTMTVSGIKFLLMSLEYMPRKDVFCWADKIIGQHPDHKVIIETHGYLTANGSNTKNRDNGRLTSGFTGAAISIGLPTGASGFEIYNELISRHNNIILVAGGHITGNVFRLNKGNDEEHWFGEMLIDYEHEHYSDGKCGSMLNSGGGWMRILTFDPLNKSIEAKTITPLPEVKKFYCSYYPEELDTAKEPLSIENMDNSSTTSHNFTLKYDFVKDITYKNTEKEIGFTHQYMNESLRGEQKTPSVAMNRETRDFVAVWADEAYEHGYDTDGIDNFDIIARIGCAKGCLSEHQITVNQTRDGNQIDPDVAMNPKGDFVVVWKNDKDSNIYMSKFAADGTRVVPEIRVNNAGKADKPTVAMADDGSFVVTWHNSNKDVGPNNEFKGWKDGNIFMRGFDANGNETFAQTKVCDTDIKTNGTRNVPDIAMDKDGNYVIVWEDDTDGNGFFEIRAIGFNKNGSKRFGTVEVNKVIDQQQRNPSIGMNSKGDFTIAWEDNSENKDVFRIRMRGFNNDGSERVTENYVSTSYEEKSATAPAVCMSDNGETVFTWFTERYKDPKVKEGESNKTKYNLALKRSLNISDNELKDQSLVSPVFWGTQDQPAIACANGGRHIILWHDYNERRNEIDSTRGYEIMGKGF